MDKNQRTWVERASLPLRQHVALIQEATSTLSHPSLRSKDASWLDEPASEKQRAILQCLDPEMMEQGDRAHITKGKASEVITFHLLRHTLQHPPPLDG